LKPHIVQSSEPKIILKKKKVFRIQHVKEQALGYLLLLPALLVITFVALIPIAQTFWISLHKLNIKFATDKSFIGLQNYAELFQDHRFWSSLSNTLIFTFVTVFFELIIGIGFALVMNRTFRGRGLVRAAILVPWSIPTVVSALMWRFMYNDQLGIVNDILYRLGFIDSYMTWLGKPFTAMVAVIVADIWKTAPFMALLLLAGLQTIHSSLYEAAKIDGANSWQIFWRVTLPLLKPTILVAVLFRTLDAFRVFDLVYVLTGGGPANSTEMISMYAYKTLTGHLDFGYGSTISIVIFVVVITICVIFIKLLGTNVQRS
jgi:multiple sugar transport system permease protein